MSLLTMLAVTRILLFSLTVHLEDKIFSFQLLVWENNFLHTVKYGSLGECCLSRLHENMRFGAILSISVYNGNCALEGEGCLCV